MEIDQPFRDETHPDPLPSNYRKIELQSPQDLTYLQDNLAKVALEKLNFVLPDNPSQSKPATVISLGGQQVTASSEEAKDDTTEIESDPLKEQVRMLVSEFLQNTWTSAQENVTVNGLDASNVPVPHTATLSKPTQSQTMDLSTNTAPANRAPLKEKEGIHFTYSPFDARLQHKLANLHGELEKLTAEVSKLRREAPRKAAMTYETALDKHMNTDEEAYTTATNQDANWKSDGIQLDPVRKGWSSNVKDKYTGGVRELAGISGVSASVVSSTEPPTSGIASSSTSAQNNKEPSLTETMGKTLRARDVVLEME